MNRQRKGTREGRGGGKREGSGRGLKKGKRAREEEGGEDEGGRRGRGQGTGEGATASLPVPVPGRLIGQLATLTHYETFPTLTALLDPSLRGHERFTTGCDVPILRDSCFLSANCEMKGQCTHITRLTFMN